MQKKCFVLVIVFHLFMSNVKGQSEYSQIAKFSHFVGYIKEDKIVTEKHGGIDYEVWLKNEKNAIPKTYSKTGTCFFVTTGSDGYLVTAEHVAKFTSKNTMIVISGINNSPVKYKLGDIISEKNELNWTSHPNADVSVIKLDSKYLKHGIPFISFDMLKYNLGAPFREDEVTVFGFPLSLGVGKKISAISKTSKPSSGIIELPRFDNRQRSNFFLLDDPSVSGFSGGPIVQLLPQIGTTRFDIANKNDVNKIVGLVHGTINEKGGGFAAIVPSFYIKETIESAPGFTGTFVFKHSNGKIWSERIYKNGVPVTVLSNFDSNGVRQEKGTLLNGNGTLFLYDEKNNLEMIRYYKEGSIQRIDYLKKKEFKAK